MQSIKELLPLVALTALAVLAAFVLSKTAKADELRLLELDRFSMETARIVNHNDQYFSYSDPKGATDEHWEYYTAAKFNLDLASYGGYRLYLLNTVDAATTDHQYRTTSWAWEAGADLRDKVQLFWSHHSQHLLDDSRPGEHFPLDNWYGCRIVFYQREAQP